MVVAVEPQIKHLEVCEAIHSLDGLRVGIAPCLSCKRWGVWPHAPMVAQIEAAPLEFGRVQKVCAWTRACLFAMTRGLQAVASNVKPLCPAGAGVLRRLCRTKVQARFPGPNQ